MHGLSAEVVIMTLSKSCEFWILDRPWYWGGELLTEVFEYSMYLVGCLQGNICSDLNTVLFCIVLVCFRGLF